MPPCYRVAVLLSTPWLDVARQSKLPNPVPPSPHVSRWLGCCVAWCASYRSAGLVSTPCVAVQVVSLARASLVGPTTHQRWSHLAFARHPVKVEPLSQKQTTMSTPCDSSICKPRITRPVVMSPLVERAERAERRNKWLRESGTRRLLGSMASRLSGKAERVDRIGRRL